MIADRPTVLEALPFALQLYNGIDECTLGSGGVGGHLHIALDDENLEDYFVEWCFKEAQKDGCVTCAQLAELMTRMSDTQRSKLARLTHAQTCMRRVI